MKLGQVVGLSLGVFGIVVLDLGFIASSATDIFYLPPPLQTIATTKPPVPSPPSILGINLLQGGNVFLYLIGAASLGIAMVILVLTNRISGQAPRDPTTDPLHDYDQKGRNSAS